MLEFPCAISSLYITSSVLFLLLLHLWGGGAWIIHHDVCILIFPGKAPHIAVEENRLGHIKCCLLWAMNNKLIPIFTVISHFMAFMYKSEWQDVVYPLWVIPNRIWVSREVTNIVGVIYSWIAVNTKIFYIRGIYDVWQIFPIDEGVACWLIF